jgi:hypothetical protein
MIRITNQREFGLHWSSVVSAVACAIVGAYAVINDRWILGTVFAVYVWSALVSHKREAKRRIIEVRCGDGGLAVDRVDGNEIAIPQHSIEEVKLGRKSLTVLFRRNEELLDYRLWRRDFDFASWDLLRDALGR